MATTQLSPSALPGGRYSFTAKYFESTPENVWKKARLRGVEIIGDHHDHCNGGDYVEIIGKLKNADAAARVTSNTTLSTSYGIVFADTNLGAITLTLPAGENNAHYKIINCGSSGNDLTVAADSFESIWNESTIVLSDGNIIDLHYNDVVGWW
jgi:hypothetical protein